MAQIYEQVVVIRLSKLVKDLNDAPSLIPEDFVSTIETISEDLVGDRAVVEVEIIGE